VGNTGLEQPASLSGNLALGSTCDAQCDALPADRVELLARAVVLVAGMAIPEAAREAVLARVIDELAGATMPD